MQYSLNISGGESEAIDIAKGDDILKVTFKIFQNDKGFNDRSDRLFNSIDIEGKIRKETKQATKDMLDWSKKIKATEVYKSAEIKVYQGDEVIRDYFLKDMYCAAYTETMSEQDDADRSSSWGKFALELRQRSGSIDTIKVDCN